MKNYRNTLARGNYVTLGRQNKIIHNSIQLGRTSGMKSHQKTGHEIWVSNTFSFQAASIQIIIEFIFCWYFLKEKF